MNISGMQRRTWSGKGEDSKKLMGRSLFDNRDITEPQTERELKQKGWDMYRVSQSLGNKVKGIEMVIRSHYERSKEAYGNDHPDFETYIKHWLRAQQECDLIDTYTMASLILRHGRTDEPMMLKGKTYWRFRLD